MNIYHIYVTIKNDEGKTQSYILDDVYYKDKDLAIDHAEEFFQKTSNVIMVEVFQSGIARPIAFFE